MNNFNKEISNKFNKKVQEERIKKNKPIQRKPRRDKVDQIKKEEKNTNKNQNKKNNNEIYNLLTKSGFVIFAILMLVILIFALRRIRKPHSIYNKTFKMENSIDVEKYKVDKEDVEEMKKFLEK